MGREELERCAAIWERGLEKGGDGRGEGEGTYGCGFGCAVDY
jgi:hypothetical protein